MQMIDREKIKEHFIIAMEFLSNDATYADSDAMKEYVKYSEDQDQLKSFESFPGVAEFLKDVLNAEFERLPSILWSHESRKKVEGITKTFIDIICYTLTDFHSNCKQALTDSKNHERTSFVKYIVPMFKYFSQETNLIEFSWCEKALEVQEAAALESNGFVINCTDRKFADGLGKSSMTKNEELFMESSSGFEKERVNHSLDDTLKLTVECSNALHHIIKQNKKASIDSIVQKSTFGVKTIKQTLTLTKMNLTKNGKWKFVEMRSSAAPTSWDLRNKWSPLFELLATLYLELLKQRELDQTIIKEVCGLKSLFSKRVTEHFGSK